MRALWVVGLIAVVGCKQEGPGPVLSAPAARVAADERDALWALAPEGATFGLVASPRGVAMIERGLLAAQDLLASSVDFASINSQLMHALLRSVGSMNPTLAGFGLTRDKGFAIFVAGDGQLVLVLPVGDHDKFLATAHGSKGADGDDLDGWVCKTIDGRYVCVQGRELLAKLGRGGLDVTRRTARARGDLELAGRDVPGPVGQSIAAVAELDRGMVIVRGTVGGAPRAIVDKLGAPSRPRVDSATAAGFGVIDLAPILAMLPPVPIAPAVTLADLGRSISGPITYVIGSGTTDPGIRIPLNDPAPATAVVEHCADLPPLARVGATVHDGVCRFPIPGAGAGVAFDGWIDGKELRIGDRAAVKASSVLPSRLARELAQGQWSAAFFGRGSYLDLKQVRSQLQALPTEAELVVRALPLFSELGIGIRKDGDALHFVVGARTVWTNPDDVLQKLLAMSSDDLLSGKGTELGKAIASAAPTSPFAQDFKAGPGGLVGVTAPIGIITAVAIPALMDSMKRTRHPQAEVHLNEIGKASGKAAAGFPLVAARAALKTAIFHDADPTPAEDPPKDLFIKSHYRRGTEELVAYETPPKPGARRPAIVWIAGGFHWGIDSSAWAPAPRRNDQSAAALRPDGIVLMLPALRGASGNRGKPECFLGEVDDLLAAGEHLSKRPDVDPTRIYLGGHSTGGTLALLAAASTDRFRAVFAFGPVADPRQYGSSGCLPKGRPNAEYAARAPVNWIDSVVTPTLVIEGEFGNADSFPLLQEHASPAVKFLAVTGADHFSVLAPASEAIAHAILADTGPKVAITLDGAALSLAVAGSH
jgi:acetyl esterase/lipase